MTDYKIRRKRAPLRLPLAEAQVSDEDLRVAFARRLQEAMDAKGWSQSDLARAATLHMTPKGDEIAEITRDNISKYMNGKMLPRGDRLQALAKALDVAPGDLISTKGVTSFLERDAPSAMIDTGGGRAWLRINQEVPWATALKVLELLKGEPTD